SAALKKPPALFSPKSNLSRCSRLGGGATSYRESNTTLHITFKPPTGVVNPLDSLTAVVGGRSHHLLRP
ncbi:hypothetical protein A2U01_0058586, partial [Trifolium medium]|nr:hypothetical protein [Trifolium medium]